MHELSIAMSILDLAAEEVQRHGDVRVLEIHLKLGPLSGVVMEALLSAYQLARECTPFEAAQLVIEEVPIQVHCPSCNATRSVVSMQNLCCAACGTPSARCRQRTKPGTCSHGNPMNVQTRLVQVRQHVVKQNDEVARVLRQRFLDAGVFVVSLVSSPGTGKTAFLEKMLGLLRGDYRVAALVGDLATDNDAQRLARAQVPIRQIITGTVCHLEAEMVRTALEGWDLNDLDFLFVENVGNLVCPSTYDLGEALRLVLLSVTEGEDKPLKYPPIFNSADVAVLTKIDLAVAVEFDRAAARSNIQSVRPGMRIIEVSAKTGQGMDECMQYFQSRLVHFRAARDSNEM